MRMMMMEVMLAWRQSDIVWASCGPRKNILGSFGFWSFGKRFIFRSIFHSFVHLLTYPFIHQIFVKCQLCQTPLRDGDSELWGEYSKTRDQNKLAEEKERLWLAAGKGAEVETKSLQWKVAISQQCTDLVLKWSWGWWAELGWEREDWWETV